MRTNVAFMPTVTDRRHCSVTPALPIAQSSFLRTSQHYPKELMHRVRTSSCFQWRDAVSTTTGSVTRCYATFGQTPEPNGVSPPTRRGNDRSSLPHALPRASVVPAPFRTSSKPHRHAGDQGQGLQRSVSRTKPRSERPQ
jgi:hypothetical protein